MKQRLPVALCLALSLLGASTGSAKTLKVPEKQPLFSVDIPPSWTAETIDDGVSCESDDQEVTILFEVTDEKGNKALVEETFAWLKEQGVTLDLKTQKEGTINFGGLTWETIRWDGSNEEWGEAEIAFIAGDLGNGKIAVITYWITKTGGAKHHGAVDKIMASFKRI